MELRPTEGDQRVVVGLCLVALGDLDGAAAAFQLYVQGDSRRESREFVITARQHLADLERARANVGAGPGGNGGAEPPPPGPAAALAEARPLRQRGRTEEAIARYRAAIAACGRGSAEAHAELGALLVEARRPGEAVEVLRDAVRLAPTAAPAWYHLGFALRQSGRPAESVAAYRRYITFRPKDPDPLYGLARAYASLGKDQEALLAFRSYTMLETRPTERQWVKKARLEIARLESKLGGPPPSPEKKSTTPGIAPVTGSVTGSVTAPITAPGQGSAPAALAPPSIRSAAPAETTPPRQP
jgi:tetratricopeptide (TPR) repeat protein